MADDKVEKEGMPKEARRRGGADTLFSAAWFDDEDDFAKAAGKGATPAGAPEGPGVVVAKVAPKPAEAPTVAEPDEAPSRGPSMALLAIGGLVVVMGLGCLLSVVAAGAAFGLGLFSV
jgi:hypothetical protein